MEILVYSVLRDVGKRTGEPVIKDIAAKKSAE